MADKKKNDETTEETPEAVEETPVAEKRVVPKERVRLDTEVQTEDRQVSETVRKEQLDVDESGTTR